MVNFLFGCIVSEKSGIAISQKPTDTSVKSLPTTTKRFAASNAELNQANLAASLQPQSPTPFESSFLFNPQIDVGEHMADFMADLEKEKTAFSKEVIKSKGLKFLKI